MDKPIDVTDPPNVTTFPGCEDEEFSRACARLNYYLRMVNLEMENLTKVGLTVTSDKDYTKAWYPISINISKPYVIKGA